MKEKNLTAIIIAKNAEIFIEDCIKSLEFCHEILVVDGGSTDKTVHIAKKLGAKPIRGNEKDFAKQRNIGLDHATTDWVLYVDSDERITPALEKTIREAVTHGKYDAYELQRKNFYLGNHEWPKIEKLARLFKKSKLKKWYGRLHETAEVDGEIGLLDGFLLHYTHRDLSSMLEKTIMWSQTEAELRLATNHPRIVWWRLVRVMITGFWESYIMQGGWKAGTAGFIESLFQSYSMFVTYARLWEMQTKHKT